MLTPNSYPLCNIMNRIDKKFSDLKKDGKKAFVAFLTAGYPSLAATQRLVLEFEKRGADIIELGVPFSDPVADGPVIQASSYEALKKGATLSKILSLVRSLREKTQIPLTAMSYFNPILDYGTDRFIEDAKVCGLDAVIIPDLPIEEEISFRRNANRKGLEVILFMAPTTLKPRAKAMAKHARGFVYFVSLAGVTGARRQLPKELSGQLKEAKRIFSGTPVCAGFGVSTKEQVKFLSSYCDGVIVGSAIVKKISQNLGNKDMV
ncbi:MAG TPA: tryptophan synthase subunit alpha, partial [Candidatus Omnitrophota bacterium]|nr:tryptophan synthase subunit alpha [Candidatus Omnitrophota bacterium]